MRKMKTSLCVAVASGLAIGFVAGLWSDGSGQQAYAQNRSTSKVRPARISPTKALADRDMYFPGTEDLARDEMRVTALGTTYAMARMKEMYAWDLGTRSGVIDFRGGVLEVNEFPFDGINEVIYKENGVTIRSIPAIHGLDGAVSFILEWKGLKFVYGSDTIPNKWYIEHAAGTDLAIFDPFSDFTKSGVEPFTDVAGPIYDEINELYGTNYEPFFKG